VGHTPILEEWWTYDHLSAISAISLEGKLYFRCQEGALNSADVVAFLAHLLREVPGQIVVIWDGAPIHRSHVIQEFLANGASRRIHLEPLPAYAPELNPGEGLWQQLKGVELRNVCCLDILHLHQELRDAVKRVRRKPRTYPTFLAQNPANLQQNLDDVPGTVILFLPPEGLRRVSPMSPFKFLL